VIDLEDAEDLKLFLASTSQKLLNLTGRWDDLFCSRISYFS
jgi:hypothetical protein